MKVEDGAPKEYPLVHLAKALGENEALDEFVRKLCDEISSTMDTRKETLEPVWEDCEQNYWATGGPENIRESNLDFTITFETCKQASSNLTNPIFAQDTVYVAKARPGFPTLAATHDILLDWMTDQYDIVGLVNGMIRHAQIYTKMIVKSPWVREERTVKFWNVGADGEMFEDQRTEVVREGSIPHLCDPRRIFHPIPCSDIDKATWWCEKFDTNVAEIKRKVDSGYYRADLVAQAVGDPKMTPEQDKEKEELYIANQMEGQRPTPHELAKLELYETYTTFEGNEVFLVLDIPRRTWVTAHSPHYQEYPRPYVDWCWHEVSGSIDGKSLCGVTDMLHRGYVAIMNILLDAGLRSIEPLVLALKDLGLSEYLDEGRLGPGLVEVEKLVIEKVSDGIAEIKLTSGEVAFLLTLLERIEKHLRDASSIPPAFYGEELAERPTATGTSAVLEKAMQPLYELMTRFRRPMHRLIEIQYSQLRQFKPKNLRIFIDAQGEAEKAMLEAMLIEFPPGYWRDQVVLETKVNSQTMSKAIKKQEALAMVDKWPELANTILSLGEAAASGSPITPIAANALDVFDALLVIWLTEFEMPEVRDVIEIQAGKVAGQAIAEMWSKYEQVIAQLQQKIIDMESKLVDLGEDVPEEPAAGGPPGGPGQPQAA